jgi:phosphatidylserine decarboxylase
LAEAEFSIFKYPSIGAFFTRRLKPGIRPIAKNDFVHPADSLISQASELQNSELIQAKGKTYSLTEFVADLELSKKLQNGFFATYYLCPTDYHRVHSPVSGVIKKRIHIPGDLWPVNSWSTENIDSVFAVNERVVVEIETQQGMVAVVFVGATNVGKISLSFESDFFSNQGRQNKTTKLHKTPIQKGDELGVFHMGSTVVVICENKKLISDTQKLLNQNVKMGSWV